MTRTQNKTLKKHYKYVYVFASFLFFFFFNSFLFIFHPVHSIFASNINTMHSTRASSLPLTKENLKHLDSKQKFNSHSNNEILERYCREIEYARDINRSQSTPPVLKNDLVVASPRILPFPYHNDSLFLPTAEQIHYHLHSDSLSTSRTESFSTLPPDSSVLISRPHSTTNIIHGDSNYSISMNSGVQYQHERRSLPARLEHQLMSKRFKKFRRTSSIASSSIATSIVEQPPPPIKLNNDTQKKPWIKRIMKIFTKTKKPVNNNNGPVWYCQYSENPTSRFEKYYNYDPIAIVS